MSQPVLSHPLLLHMECDKWASKASLLRGAASWNMHTFWCNPDILIQTQVYLEVVVVTSPALCPLSGAGGCIPADYYADRLVSLYFYNGHNWISSIFSLSLCQLNQNVTIYILSDHKGERLYGCQHCSKTSQHSHQPPMQTSSFRIQGKTFYISEP